MSKEYNEQTPMPFGKHKGTRLSLVPASYLIYLYDSGLSNGPLRRYIDERLDDLYEEERKREQYNNFFRRPRR